MCIHVCVYSHVGIKTYYFRLDRAVNNRKAALVVFLILVLFRLFFNVSGIIINIFTTLFYLLQKKKNTCHTDGFLYIGGSRSSSKSRRGAFRNNGFCALPSPLRTWQVVIIARVWRSGDPAHVPVHIYTVGTYIMSMWRISKRKKKFDRPRLSDQQPEINETMQYIIFDIHVILYLYWISRLTTLLIKYIIFGPGIYIMYTRFRAAAINFIWITCTYNNNNISVTSRCLFSTLYCIPSTDRPGV